MQIRTKEMHEIAEFGIARHWAYKEGKTAETTGTLEKKLTWFRQILEWQNEASNAEEFMESLKIDLFSDMVFVFTPKGDVMELPLDLFRLISRIVSIRKLGIKQLVQK